MDSIFANRQITVSYAYKKDTKGERHGTPAERVLAASNPTAQKSRPHTLFASGPPTLPDAPQANGTIPTSALRPWQAVVGYDACARLCLPAWAMQCMEAPHVFIFFYCSNKKRSH